MSNKTFEDRLCVEDIITRISAVRPDSRALWGKMCAHQMLCHLTDSFKGVIGERDISSAKLPLPRSLAKWLILWAPIEWPHNVKTRPEVEQGIGGTPPDEFERDRRVLLAALERFVAAAEKDRGPHPMMGPLDRREWMRWGYLHTDHHLRQFGV